jgi:histidine triad (HIT) family protein
VRESCIFCKVAAGEVRAEVLYEDDRVLAFRDIHPKAPIHFLVIPRAHIATLNDLDESTAGLIGELYLAAKRVAVEQGFARAGYRTVINCNAQAGQSVFHLHLHVLAGRLMGWPPG